MIQGILFPKTIISCHTEGIKYAGSKKKLLNDILSLAGDLPGETVWDAFSGTTRVSQAFAQNDYKVISSDRSVWSECFATCYLMNHHDRAYYQDLFDHLNSLAPVDGWFTEYYGSASSQVEGGKKTPWQIHNTRKLDAIRTEIDRLQLSHVEKAVALTGLILALDKVDNTLGHYVSYLKEWSARSYNDLFLSVPELFPNEKDHAVLRDDVFNLTPKVQADIAYFDPPYGSNNDKMPPSRVRYASYYHIWTTVCLNDHPDVFGQANRRVDSSDSVSGSPFEDFRKSDNNTYIAIESLDRLIREAQAPYIILSYSSGGRATADDLKDVLSTNGTLLKVREIDYRKNVMSEMRWTHDWTKDVESPNKEFLFVLKK